MTQKKAAMRIYSGPSWEQIERSLRDTELGPRFVEFGLSPFSSSNGLSIIVQLDGARRLGNGADHWELSGMTNSSGRSQRVVVNFFTSLRTGHLTFVDSREVAMASPEKRKVAALMGAVFKMVAEYQEHNAGNLSERFFRIFEGAKRVHYSEDDRSVNGISLDEAIADLKKQ